MLKHDFRAVERNDTEGIIKATVEYESGLDCAVRATVLCDPVVQSG